MKFFDNFMSDVEKDLQEAKIKFETNPIIDNLIWFGRRMAYTGRIEESIDIFSSGIEKFPDDPRLYRHRGHRFISLRKFTEAINDLEQAVTLIQNTRDEVEPDGMPNLLNIPLSTLHFNIYYHLALAYFLERNFEKAKAIFETCLSISQNNDSIIACFYWLFIIHKKLSDKIGAKEVIERISPEMEIIENIAYFEMLLLFKGLKQPEELLENLKDKSSVNDSTTYFGLALYYLFSDDVENCKLLLESLLKYGHSLSFGFICAEVEIRYL
jgi:tetratricopeptide (TPR) repeat protein